MNRIQNGIYSIEGLHLGRIYVIEAADGVTLIDTSKPGALPVIEKELRTIGRGLNDIKRILITHAHWDHHGSLTALKEATGANVYAHHRYESSVIRGEQKPFAPSYSELRGFDRVVRAIWVGPLLRHQLSVKVDHELMEGDRLDEVLPGLEVVDTPGHSPGHCSFWHSERGILFGGDVMMRSSFGRLVLPLAAATQDENEAKRSVHKVAELNVNILCLGHGQPLLDNTARKIRDFADRL
jgi:glyoxylase-like metal-dependent hydrolase (beta-lactamase superfamily II)